MTVYLGCGAGESSDEMFLIRGDVQGRGQFADVEQVLGQSSAERQDPGVETCLTWRKIKQQKKNPIAITGSSTEERELLQVITWIEI